MGIVWLRNHDTLLQSQGFGCTGSCKELSIDWGCRAQIEGADLQSACNFRDNNINLKPSRDPVMENQMEKNLENEMETGVMRGLYRGLSILIKLTLGHKVYGYYLPWATWILREIESP